MKKIILPIVYASLGGIIALSTFRLFEKTSVKYVVERKTDSGAKLANYNPSAETYTDFTTAAEKSVNAVVHIKTTATKQNPYYQNPFYNFFYGPNNQPEFQMEGAGSGVIISENGYIVTNNHVIEGADEIEIVMNNKKTFKAAIVGTDPQTDIALLKVEAEKLPYLLYGNSNETKVGEWVLAVGNPFNLTSTVTAGIVSAKGRNINILNHDPNTGMSPIESFIQTDAAVNPGNSGGALVNTKGELVGINTAIKSNTGSYAGYSFAVPVNIVKKTIADIIEYGSVQRAFIGVSIGNIDEKIATENNLTSLNGVYINELLESGSAEKAGLKKGDIIIFIEDTPVNNVAELQEKIGQYRPGNKVEVTVLRDNKELAYEITLRNIEGRTEIANNNTTKNIKLLGAQLEEINIEYDQKLKINKGIKIMQLHDGKLKNMGVKEGFIITKVDNTPIQNIEQFSKIIQNKKGGILLEGIYPNGAKAYYGLGV
jgi:Do/DeqQ family serine protease